MEENEKITEQNTDVSVEDMPEGSSDIVPDISNDNSETTSDIPQTVETTEEETTTEETTTEETTEEETTEEETTAEETTEELTEIETISVEELLTIDTMSTEAYTEVPFLEKPIDEYTTTEGLLLLLVILCVCFGLYHMIFD